MILKFNSSILDTNSSLTGTAFSAAAVGVGALKSDTKSINVVSVSWPTADITGILLLYTDLTTISSLNGHKSSKLPPPLATISKSGFLTLVSSVNWLNLSIAFEIWCAEPSPWTATGHK